MTEPKKPKSDHQPKRENAQGEHHGVPHKPEDFDVMNPAKLTPDPKRDS